MNRTFFIALIISLAMFLLLSPFFIKLTTYLHPIVLIVVLFCLVLLVFFIVLLIRKETIHLPYLLIRNLMILYTFALLILLFFRPNDQNYHSMNLVPFSTIRFYLSGKANWLISFYNLAANVGLFIPYGIFLKLKKQKSLLKLIFLPIIIIALIEILQFLTHRGSMDIDDLILNVLGIFFGYLFYPVFKRIVKPYS